MYFGIVMAIHNGECTQGTKSCYHYSFSLHSQKEIKTLQVALSSMLGVRNLGGGEQFHISLDHNTDRF